MSDCQSWLGAARSKRRGRCGCEGDGGGVSGMRPSSCRMRRTSVSETPSASKRLSTSRMRRVPKSGCSLRTATTASRFAAAAALRRSGGGVGGTGVSASTPPRS